MVREFEYGGYTVTARAVPHANGGFAGVARIADAFGEPGVGQAFEVEAGVAPTPEGAVAIAEAEAMRTIDAGEVN